MSAPTSGGYDTGPPSAPVARGRPAGPGNLTLAAFAAIGLALILVPLVLLLLNRAADREFDEVSLAIDPVSIQLARLRLDVERLHHQAAQLALSPDRDESDYQVAELRYEGSRARIQAAAAGTRYETDVAQLIERADASRQVAEDAAAAALAGDPGTAATILREDGTETLWDFSNAAGALRMELDEASEAVRERGSQLTTVELLVGMLGALLGALVILALLAMALSRRRLLAESERDRARFIGMVEATGFGVMEIDPDGKIAYLNPAAAEMVGGDVESLPGTRAARFVEEDSPLRAAIVERRPFFGEVTARRLDGTSMTVEASSRPIALSGGVGVETVVVVQDLSERIEREGQRAQFVAMASHELRSPLTSLVGFSRRLSRAVAMGRLKVDEETREALDTLRDEAQRMQDTVSLFLDMTRLDANVLELVFEPIELRHLAQKEVDALSQRYPEAIVTLVETDEEAIVETDAQRLRQVLDNLLDNAAKYGGEPPEVEVRIAREDGAYAISVRDNGPGIAPEDRDRIFERFYRADSRGGRRQRQGLGLGLAIARELAEHMGARLTFTTQEGQGTEFRLRLPADPQAQSLASDDAADQRPVRRLTWPTTS